MIRDSERCRAFITNSSEGIWRLEFDPPIDTALPVDAQVDLAYRNGRFAECNDAMAHTYALDRAEDLVGKTLEFMLPSAAAVARAYWPRSSRPSTARPTWSRPNGMPTATIGDEIHQRRQRTRVSA